MEIALKPGWSKPSTILFASEFPASEKTFAIALALAAEFGAELIIFHVYESSDLAAFETSGIQHGGHAAARAEKRRFEPLAQRARDFGIHCTIVVRPGLPAEEILAFLQRRKIDRVIMGAHTPGPIGKLLVGSVTEAVLRTANVPVNIVGPDVVESTFRNFAKRTILCSVSTQWSNHVLVSFAAELAAKHDASLILQHVIPPQERAEVLAGRTIDQIGAELLSLVPIELQNKINVQTVVVLGDPVEELLYQGRARRANLIVLGAQGASHFAAITHAGIVFMVPGLAHCPVITLSPILLAECGVRDDKPRPPEVNYIAGVI
jgi:nucleotide-binding universal stress UspA family protein